LIQQEICRRTSIAVFNQRLTLAGRELHRGDIIPPNCTLVLGSQSRGGTRSHGKFQCLDVMDTEVWISKDSTISNSTILARKNCSRLNLKQEGVGECTLYY